MTCVEGTRVIVRQIAALLAEMDDKTYSQPLDLFNGATLGQHVRHIADFYLCLLKGIQRGVVDYAERERHPGIEGDPAEALRAFESISQEVETCDETDSIGVYGDFSAHPADGRPLLWTSIGRELMFAHDHAMHHLAIIRMGIQSAFPHLKYDETLGLAPSTLKFRNGRRTG